MNGVFLAFGSVLMTRGPKPAAHDTQNVIVRRVHGHLRTLRHLSELELKSGVINAGHVA
jgi:hypothetical protein